MKKIMFTLLAALFAVNVGFAQQKTIVETAVSAGSFNTLVTAVKAAGLVDTLSGEGPFTVFAPTDDAFAKVDGATLTSLLQPENKQQLASVLTYHVVAGRVNAAAAYGLDSAKTVNGQKVGLDFRGDGLTVGNAKIVTTDIQCSNGVIHVIDAVLLPSLDSIPATAKGAGQFNTLLAAVNAAGLAEVLSGPGPFTVFAPTDEAFGKLPEGTIDSLLKPENKQKLIDILKYHVVSGRVYDTDAVKAENTSTLLGSSINISVDADGLKINDAQVVAKNLETTNGVIHVIDSVLLPKAPVSMSNHKVMDYLNQTVMKGAPVYNAGHHGQCCEIYMDCMKSIMAAGITNADDHTMSIVDKTITEASKTHSQTDRAWVLRRGIDSLYERMASMPNTIR
ncbi:MAG: fasciclin domain-containing protein [Planctomycetota bacterium]